jgi:formyl-CoA transferase
MPALERMRILDLTQYEAGTSCTQLLAWMGATVVKVEPPGRGDPGRGTEGGGKDSLYFLSFNANKRSLALDLASERGRQIFLQLVPRFDVVVENFSLGTMERFGLGYDALKSANPAIIYATNKGFGTTGPYAQFKSYDWVAQAAGGSWSVTGSGDSAPVRPGATMGDTGSGMHMALGILAAYVQKLQTGEGQMVEISMQESVASFMRMPLSVRERTGNPVPRTGNRLGAPSDLYKCAGDGPNDYVFIMTTTSRMWDTLCAAIDRPELLLDPRFGNVLDRRANGDALHDIVEEWTSQRSKFEVMEYLGAAGVPCSAVYDSSDLFADKHLRARNAIRTVVHPVRGAWDFIAPPIRMSNSDVEVQPAPLLGQHSREVLEQELGLSAGELAALAEQGVVGTCDLPVETPAAVGD